MGGFCFAYMFLECSMKTALQSIFNHQKFMKIIIKVKSGAREDKIERVDDANYTVYVKAPPIDGKANAAIVKLLAYHFDISQSLIEIISGHMARVKVVEINN